MAKYLNPTGVNILWDSIKNLVNNKVDKVDGKGLSTLDFTQEDKDKLNSSSLPTDGKKGQILVSTGNGAEWKDASSEELRAYGIAWHDSESKFSVQRVGNMNYHKTLPIQSGMRGCIYDNIKKRVVYWLDENDWRLINPESDNNVICNISPSDITGPIEGNSYRISIDISNGEFMDFIYRLHNKGCLNNRYCNLLIDNISHIGVLSDVEDNSADGEIDIKIVFSDNLNITSNSSITFVLGSCLDGREGEVMVYVPEFYIKKKRYTRENTPVGHPLLGFYSVYISTEKIDYTWEHQPEMYVSAFANTIKRSTYSPSATYIGKIGNSAALSIYNRNEAFGGGTGGISNLYGAPAFGMTFDNYYTSAKAGGKKIMSYDQYRNLYWLYVIEYGSFDSQLPYTEVLTSEGYKKGGLGQGATNRDTYNLNGRCINYGNNSYGDVNGCTYRGIENIFGNIYQLLDGIYAVPKTVDTIPNGDYIIYKGKGGEFINSETSITDKTFVCELTCDSGYIGEFIASDSSYSPDIIPGSTYTSKPIYAKGDWLEKGNAHLSNGFSYIAVGGSIHDLDKSGIGCIKITHNRDYPTGFITEVGFRTVASDNVDATTIQ